MGCDIHWNVEAKINGTWTEVPNPMRKCSWCDGTGKNDRLPADKPVVIKDYRWDAAKKEEVEEVVGEFPAQTCHKCRGTGKAPEEFYEGRNYQLFSILAGVRDYGNVTPIAPPRDVPMDMSQSIRDRYEGWGGDAHTPSWYSLKELLDFDWNGTAGHCSGIVGIEQFKTYLKTKEPPDSYCQGIGGPNVVVADPAWLAEQIMHEEVAAQQGQPAGRFLKEGVSYHARLAWPIKYKDCADGYFTDRCLVDMKQWADENKVPYEDVRAVFWFDN